MQWDDSAYGGFSDHTPWLGVNPNYKEINAASQIADDSSVFRFYQKLIALRKEHPVMAHGDLQLCCPGGRTGNCIYEKLSGGNLARCP